MKLQNNNEFICHQKQKHLLVKMYLRNEFTDDYSVFTTVILIIFPVISRDYF